MEQMFTDLMFALVFFTLGYLIKKHLFTEKNDE